MLIVLLCVQTILYELVKLQQLRYLSEQFINNMQSGFWKYLMIGNVQAILVIKATHVNVITRDGNN